MQKTKQQFPIESQNILKAFSTKIHLVKKKKKDSLYIKQLFHKFHIWANITSINTLIPSFLYHYEAYA